MIEEMYLAALARYPSADETESLTAVFEEAGPEQRREVIEDLLTSIFSSKQFVFNH